MSRDWAANHFSASIVGLLGQRQVWLFDGRKERTLTVGVKGDGRHGVHVWLGDVFDDNGDVVVPNADRLVIRSGNKSTILVDECNGVHGSQMLVVLLGDLRRVHVVLERGDNMNTTPIRCKRGSTVAYLDDLLVRHTRQEDVLFVFVRVESYDVRDLAVREGLKTCACCDIV